MNMHLAILIVLILSMGFFGGVIKFLINKKKKYKNQRSFWLDLFKAVIVGIGAAILVPLFLHMVSSNLLEQTERDDYSYFVFAGFCLIAAITSHKFISTISQQVLKTTNDVVDKIAKLKSNLEPIIAKETEPDAVNGLNFFSQDDILFDEEDTEEIKILKAITFGKYTYRTVNGLTITTRLDKSVVNEKLLYLIAEGYIKQAFINKGLRFYVTEEGQNRIYKLDKKAEPAAAGATGS